MSDRAAILERQLGIADLSLKAIADYGGCLHQYCPDNDVPCSCPVCIAKRALASETAWRYLGTHEYRLANNPREAAIVAAWKSYMTGACTGHPDYKLKQILGVNEVTPRDWLIATTLVQWMATNVGQALLFEAGYKYDPPKENK